MQTSDASEEARLDAEVASDVTQDGSPEDAPSVHNGSCCVRSASYDSTCTSMNEPPVAFVCFCPVGGDGGSIDPSCTINTGTELVCCP